METVTPIDVPLLIDDTPSTIDISVDDLVRLGAVDNEFFCQTFFPKTFRQKSAPFHKRIDSLLENPDKRFLNIRAFRGSAKTTRLRTFAMKRIAYRMSRTILVIGPNEPAASRTAQWIRGQMERNKLLTTTFGLHPGKKWHETELEIVSEIDNTTTWILGVGVTSNLRGINFDDYRPDLILCDDILTDENVLTDESRKKIVDLVLGAVAKSLAPVSEEPNAKLVLLQTPMHVEDVSSLAKKSEMWHTEDFPCWTDATIDLPDALQESAWPDRFSSEELRKEKRNNIQMGKVHIFAREMEISLVASDAMAFKPEMLNFYEDKDLKGRGTTVISIDPVPPPSDKEIEKNLAGKNYEAIVVQTRLGGNYYLRHYELNRGHDPSWTLAKVFELALKYQISYIAVDATAYQAVLKWLLETEMKRKGVWYVVIPDRAAGKKSKYQKIVDAIGTSLMYRKYFAKKVHTEFIAHLSEYPSIKYDDLLDAIAIGLRALINPAVELGESEYTVIDESEIEENPYQGKCP